MRSSFKKELSFVLLSYLQAIFRDSIFLHITREKKSPAIMNGSDHLNTGSLRLLGKKKGTELIHRSLPLFLVSQDYPEAVRVEQRASKRGTGKHKDTTNI